MENCCEICAGFLTRARLAGSRGQVTEVVFEEQTLLLCATHAYIAAELGVTSVTALRHLFRESSGRRSFLPRRKPRVSAAVEKEERSGRGRRAEDWN
jgi:hypothetical protein